MMQDHKVHENVALRVGRFVSDIQWRDLSEP